jgi:4-hydroxy-3-polyprenylbenzoate decarboxylase
VNLTVALTGASGAIFGCELLRALEADERVARVHFVASENSLRVIAEELGVNGRTQCLEKLLGAAPKRPRSTLTPTLARPSLPAATHRAA